MRSRNLESQTCSFLLILVAHSCMYPRVLRSYSNIEIRERFSLCFTNLSRSHPACVSKWSGACHLIVKQIIGSGQVRFSLTRLSI
jgi:hypothetical protein